MNIPLFCYTCDMITGHFTERWFKAKCRKCGAMRKVPIFRWILLVIAIITLLAFTVWLFINSLYIAGILQS